MGWVVCNACDWGQHEQCAKDWTPHPTRRPLAVRDTAQGIDRWAGCWVECECYKYSAVDHPEPADNPWLERVNNRGG